MTGGDVIKNVAALKLQPGYECETADEVLHGMTVWLERTEHPGWFRAKTQYEYYGYLHMDDVLIGNEKAAEWESEVYTIWQPIVDVMAEPKYSSYVVLTLVRGCRVKFTGEISDKWEKIGLADGSYGWIRQGFAKMTASADLRDAPHLGKAIADTALDYLGCQYRWGGKSPLGIDCSGLASMAYMLNGVIIPRDSDLQLKFFRPISREEAKPGDLFFFSGHVAVCIGEGRYVHATGREGFVLINSFNKESGDYREDLDRSHIGTGTLF